MFQSKSIFIPLSQKIYIMFTLHLYIWGVNHVTISSKKILSIDTGYGCLCRLNTGFEIDKGVEMGIWNTLKIGASGLTAQRMRLDVISNNIANKETTSTAEGGVFQRSDVVFRAAEQPAFLSTLLKVSNDSDHKSALLNSAQMKGVEVTEIVKDPSPGTRVYEPSHVDADEEGYVEYPNVNLVVEMTNMISATRSYEASLNAITAAKSMATKALELGR